MPLLELPQPFDFTPTTERFRAFGPDRSNAWEDGVLHRVLAGGEVRIAAAPGGVDVEPLDAEIGPAVVRLLGGPFDLDGFYAWAGADEVLAPLVHRLAGFRPPLSLDPFEALVGAILAQQVSLFSARAIGNRMIERFGERHDAAWAFPTRERLAAATQEELLAIGFSRAKAGYVVGLARADLELGALAALPDDEVKARLTAVRGIGEWTADWFLARHLARPHAWPWGDLALRKAVARFYGDVHVRDAGARFHPFQNLTAHYLLTASRVP